MRDLAVDAEARDDAIARKGSEITERPDPEAFQQIGEVMLLQHVHAERREELGTRHRRDDVSTSGSKCCGERTVGDPRPRSVVEMQRMRPAARDARVDRFRDLLAQRVLTAEVARGSARCEHAQTRTNDLHARAERLDHLDDRLVRPCIARGVVEQHLDLRDPRLRFATPHPFADTARDSFG